MDPIVIDGIEFESVLDAECYQNGQAPFGDNA